jgi:carbamoyl-phosphate synthase small subunit
LRARLLLEDGEAIDGCGFGRPRVSVGEVVFTTGMTGYVEALTAPSYAGQILVWTHPMVGCYGVPARTHSIYGIPIDYESDRVQVEGFVASELPLPSHYLSVRNLHEWLGESGVPGMYKVDTRALVKRIRERGVMMGILATFNEKDEVGWDALEKTLRYGAKYDTTDFTERVSPKEPVTHEPPAKPTAAVSVLDCGLKYGILRQLLRLGFRVTRFPCDTGADELLDGFRGVVISNGPGNPAMLMHQVKTVREVVESGTPILGICLGMQLLPLAFDADTYKLRYGHRGPNKGVVDVVTGRSYITTQNHGYAVNEATLRGTGLTLWFRNVDDETVEGVRHVKLPAIGVQFHPEGGPGPRDTSWIFELFKKMVSKCGDS